MDGVSLIIAVVLAAIIWKCLKGVLKVVMTVAIILVIAWQLYPYITNLFETGLR